MPHARLLRTAGALGATAAMIAAWRAPRLRRRARHTARLAAAEARHLRGVVRGIEYRAAGREPDPMVDDLTLADRVRSELGRLEHRLDIPRVHVMVRNHVATLHGEVHRDDEVAELERRVLQVAGIWGVRSFLRVAAPG
jgi:osmotically-inducible protein OsmY